MTGYLMRMGESEKLGEGHGKTVAWIEVVQLQAKDCQPPTQARKG